VKPSGAPLTEACSSGYRTSRNLPEKHLLL
jgi:hypothetical protein